CKLGESKAARPVNQFQVGLSDPSARGGALKQLIKACPGSWNFELGSSEGVAAAIKTKADATTI
ncbi:hypothetical protein, partial [Beijerinckia sp. L45]|uniref:hypothetical protein n=1 Tax=Beijerinckia sp. L45 TaxID=1641855 RepID=UPI001AED2BA5